MILRERETEEGNELKFKKLTGAYRHKIKVPLPQPWFKKQTVPPETLPFSPTSSSLP